MQVVFSGKMMELQSYKVKETPNHTSEHEKYLAMARQIQTLYQKLVERRKEPT